MSSPLFTRILLIFALLFAQQAGAEHALHHALEDLTQKQAPHSDNCEQCATYAQLGSALNVGTYDFTPQHASGATIPHRATHFRFARTRAAVARGPPYSA